MGRCAVAKVVWQRQARQQAGVSSRRAQGMWDSSEVARCQVRGGNVWKQREGWGKNALQRRRQEQAVCLPACLGGGHPPVPLEVI